MKFFNDMTPDLWQQCRNLLCLLPVFVALLGCERSAIDEADHRHPNIVVILADDLGYGDIGVYNAESKIPTPSLDNLAQAGLRFTDAHSPSSVCTPSRYGLLTGRYAWRSRLKRGVLQGYDPSLIEPDRATVASLLRDRGYATAAIGKWHLGLGDEHPTNYDQPLSSGPLTAGFDYFFGIPASLDMAPFVYIENDRVVEGATNQIEEGVHRRNGGDGYWQAGAIAPGFDHTEVMPRLIEKSVEYIAQQADRAQPFFLYIPLTAPHKPWLPTDEFVGVSEAGFYGDFVAQVDASVQQILDALNDANLVEDTLVIVTSDNGSRWEPFEIDEFRHMANGPLRGQKTEIYEGGHRVPLIAAWPGRIPEGTTTDALVSLTDIYATFAELTGSASPLGEAEDSISFLRTLLGSEDSFNRTSMILHSSKGVFAVREGRWKWIETAGHGGYGWTRIEDVAGQVYDLDVDLAESKDLINERLDIESRMRLSLEEEQSR